MLRELTNDELNQIAGGDTSSSFTLSMFGCNFTWSHETGSYGEMDCVHYSVDNGGPGRAGGWCTSA
jgi:bacteriocin-like protein